MALAGCTPEAPEPSVDGFAQCGSTSPELLPLSQLSDTPACECDGFGDITEVDRTPDGWTESLADLIDRFEQTRTGTLTTASGETHAMTLSARFLGTGTWFLEAVYDEDDRYAGCYELPKLDVEIHVEAEGYLSFSAQTTQVANICSDGTGFRSETAAEQVDGGDPPPFEAQTLLMLAHTASGLADNDWEGELWWLREDLVSDAFYTTSEELATFTLP